MFLPRCQISPSKTLACQVYADKAILGSIVVSIPACHAGDRGSIPRRGGSMHILPPQRHLAVWPSIVMVLLAFFETQLCGIYTLPTTISPLGTGIA